MQRKAKSIAIPATLYENIKKRIQGTSFRSVSDYIVYLIRREIEEENELRQPHEQ